MTGRRPLSTREKRAWAKRLLEAQEAVETAEASRDRLMADGMDAGLSYATIEMSTGLGPVTVRNSIDAGRTGEGR